MRLFTASAVPEEIQPDVDRLYRRISADNNSSELLSAFSDCFEECRSVIAPKACYMLLPVKCSGSELDFEVFTISSAGLSKNLGDSVFCAAMGATVGIGIDRVIAKYSALSPLKAWICQLVGAAYIESWCDLLCQRIKNETGFFLKPRYSPGYGDLQLAEQTKLFTLLDLPKKCGLTLTEALIMRPSKSVTAFAGLSERPYCPVNKCSLCNKTDCEYRND